MHRTAEVRWFFAGPLPSAMRTWFAGGGDLAPAQSRTDEYLLFPSTVVGVKFRQRTLEIKALVADHGVRRWAVTSGRMQTWVKWSCGAAEVATLRRRVRADPSLLVAVQKRRSLRTFAIDRGLREVRADQEHLPAAGCDVELTEIMVGRRRYWTFSFESFSAAHPERLIELLRVTAAHCLHDRARPRRFRTRRSPADSLTAATSLSYPEWLVRHVQRLRA